jgi:thioredoxin reductase
MQEVFDVIVLGGGPAGMAAAAQAAGMGARTLLIDEQPSAGGQIYRHVERNFGNPALKQILGADYADGIRLVQEVQRSGCRFMWSGKIFYVGTQPASDGDAGPRFELGVVTAGCGHLLQSRRLIVATGAIERAAAFEGWTLPGVLTAGAAQILLKSDGAILDGKIAIAGHGPLLLLVIHQLLVAGADLEAIVDLLPAGNTQRALRSLPTAMLGPRQLLKGLGWLIHAWRSGVAIRRSDQIVRVAAGGRRRLAVTFSRAGHLREIEVDWLITHIGVVPNLPISRALRCAHQWDPISHCSRPLRDETLQSSITGAYIAGDAGGIIGAAGSAIEGRMAALAAVASLSGKAHGRAMTVLRKARSSIVRQRRFIDELFLPSSAQRVPGDNVIVCRCEEVTAAEIRSAIASATIGVNQVKFFTRAGMGPCQGRQCGLMLSEMVANALGAPVDVVGALHGRPPIKPVLLGELAQFARETRKSGDYVT